MAHKPMVMSVMHSATTFLLDFIQPDVCRHVHQETCVELAKNAETIAVPLRHPLKIWQSFAWRGKPEPLFWVSLANLDWFDRLYGDKIVYLPVDRTIEREEGIDRLNAMTGQNYKPAWSVPKGGFEGERTPVEPPDIEPVARFAVMGRFYGTPWPANRRIRGALSG